jgi:hypothetical protein
MQEFLDDVERASAAVIGKQQSQMVQLGAEDGEDSISNLKNRITALKKRLHSLLIQASYKGSSIKTEPSEEEDSSVPRPAPGNVREDKRVLTLFGNPSNPKQLFSGLQKPMKVPLGPDKQDQVEIQPPLPEDKLPNGITAIKAIPFSLDMDEKPTKTFGEMFAPRATLPQLEPPRRARSWARNPSTMWIDPFEAMTDLKAVPGEKNNYRFASLPSVSWLQYGGATSSPSYWNRKQKQQDYSGEDYAQQQDNYSIAYDDPALLQGVYSSFAPSYDSSSSIVQADSKSLVWWAKRGARRFKTLLSLHYGAGAEEQQPELPDLDEASLEEAVNSFNPEDVTKEVSNEAAQSEAETESKDVEDILREVSELLGTLDSYRQIRNLDAPANNLHGDPKDTSPDVGTADTPSSTEQTVYETLKASLAAIISNLPPYVVAKLNGEQLADLNLSQKILIENPVYNGTMEEDDFTVWQKRIAAATPAHTVTPSRSGAYQGSPAYNQRVYPSSNRPQPPAAQPPAGYQGYYGSRNPSTSSPYTPGTTPQSFTGPRLQASPSQRPSHVPGYSQPGGQYMQRPNGYSPYPGQQGAPPPQGSPQPYAQRPGQSGYQQNPQYAAGRSASPQKPPAYATPQPRTPYMNPGSNNPARYYPSQHQQQQPTHYGSYPSTQPPAPSTPYSNSAAAATNSRSATELAVKAQTAANQQRQSSGTPNPPTSQPQPPQQNHEQSASQDRSASPANKQSSTPVST